MMNTTPAVFIFLTFMLAMAYLIWEHKRLNAPPPGQSPPPDHPDLPVSVSAIPGNLEGPGATSNSGWYAPPPNASMIPGGY
jgi:hypothetical protein